MRGNSAQQIGQTSVKLDEKTQKTSIEILDGVDGMGYTTYDTVKALVNNYSMVWDIYNV